MDGNFPELRLLVHTFVPSQLLVDRNKALILNDMPIAILPRNMEALQSRILEYIDYIIENRLWPDHIPETINQVLAMILRFRDRTDNHVTVSAYIQ